MIPHPYLIGAGVLSLGAWLLLKPKAPAAPPWTPQPYAPPAADPFVFQPAAEPEYAPYFPTDPKYGPYVHETPEPFTAPWSSSSSSDGGYASDDVAMEGYDEEEEGDWTDASAWFSGRRHGVNLLHAARKTLGI